MYCDNIGDIAVVILKRIISYLGINTWTICFQVLKINTNE